MCNNYNKNDLKQQTPKTPVRERERERERERGGSLPKMHWVRFFCQQDNHHVWEWYESSSWNNLKREVLSFCKGTSFSSA